MAASYGTASLQAAVAFLLAELDRLPSPPPAVGSPQQVLQPSAKPSQAQSRRGRTNTAPVTSALPPLRTSDLLNNAALIDAISRLVQRVERAQPQRLFQALLAQLQEPTGLPTIAACQSLAHQLDCLSSLLRQTTTTPAAAASESEQAGQLPIGDEDTGSGQAVVDRLLPLLSGRYVCLHTRVLQLLLQALSTSSFGSSMRLPLQQLVTYQWTLQAKPSLSSSTSALAFPLPLSSLCELSCGLLSPAGDAAFASSLQTAVLSCMLSHPQPASRLVINPPHARDSPHSLLHLCSHFRSSLVECAV